MGCEPCKEQQNALEGRNIEPRIINQKLTGLNRLETPDGSFADAGDCNKVRVGGKKSLSDEDHEKFANGIRLMMRDLKENAK